MKSTALSVLKSKPVNFAAWNKRVYRQAEILCTARRCLDPGYDNPVYERLVDEFVAVKQEITYFAVQGMFPLAIRAVDPITYWAQTSSFLTNLCDVVSKWPRQHGSQLLRDVSSLESDARFKYAGSFMNVYTKNDIPSDINNQWCKRVEGYNGMSLAFKNQPATPLKVKAVKFFTEGLTVELSDLARTRTVPHNMDTDVYTYLAVTNDCVGTMVESVKVWGRPDLLNDLTRLQGNISAHLNRHLFEIMERRPAPPSGPR